ncbi:ubiquinol-cytochrome c reductase iron-sulfur subunit [Halorientalis halophila]|uniref:QcrA and Rieske domain-containing protein n=1 Tax=Halorientalis halophila TaxID=3108499 RepID=UPI0030090C7C
MPTDTRPDDPHAEIEIERRQVAKVLAAVSGVGAVSAFGVSSLAGLAESGKVEEPEPVFVEGVRLVDADGNPLSAADALPATDELDVATVYAEAEGGGPVEEDRGTVLLARFPRDSYEEPTNLDGVAEGYAAYSKVCTHLGCLVDGTEGNQFNCQCHGSVFDPLKGAEVTSGPAPRALPQLPLGVAAGETTEDGATPTDAEAGQLLLATGPIEGPIGPE